MSRKACSAYEVLANEPPPMWPHQESAVKHCLSRKGSLLNFGMGTGKSRIAVELSHAMEARRVLILAPLAVCGVWLNQFRAWSRRNLTVLVLDERAGNAAKKAALLREYTSIEDGPLVVVVNYDSCWRAPLAEALKKQSWDLLVCDESHKLKSPAGAASKYVARLSERAAKRVLLSGTPMPHGPLDIWAQFRALDPTVFGGSFTVFRARYAEIDYKWGYAQIKSYRRQDELAARIATCSLTASRDLLQLPQATHNEIIVDLSKEARAIYDELAYTLCAEIEDGIVTASNALVKLLRLQQCTGGCVPVESLNDGTRTEARVDDSKTRALGDILEGLPEEEPVVVFCRYRADLDQVHEAAKQLGRASLELSGRVRQLGEWQAGHAPVLAVQIQSGGIGVDLTRAAYCVFYSLSYSLGEYEQALARCHRPGQHRPVSYYHLVARDTVDQRVYSALQSKADVVEAVIDEVTKKETQ